MISVIIPTYDNPKELKKSLASLAKQTYKDLEIIVIDDGSQESVDEIIDDFAKRLSKLHHYRIPHGGANMARQYGAELASGEYLIFWDSDVVAKPEMLETMLETLRNNPRASYAYSRYVYGHKGFKVWPFNEAKLKAMPYIHTTSLIRQKHFPGWDKDLDRLQDWDLWLTMLEQDHKGIYIPKYLFRIITGGTISAWLPKYAYRKPFKYLLPKKIKDRIKRYENAVRVIKKKHNL